MGLISEAAMLLTEDTIRENVTPDGRRIITTAPSLCRLLDEAVVSSTGGSMKGATLASEKVIINVDAMKLRDRIRARCIEPLTINHKTVAYGDTAAIVRQWASWMDDLYTSAGMQYQGGEDAKITGWADEINTILDPPHVIELRSSCPECHERKIGNRWVLSAMYHDGEEPYAECAACGHVWVGQQRLLELGYHVNAVAA